MLKLQTVKLDEKNPSKITFGLTPRRRARSTRAGDFIGNSFILCPSLRFLYPSLPVPPLLCPSPSLPVPLFPPVPPFLPVCPSFSLPLPPSQSAYCYIRWYTIVYYSAIHTCLLHTMVYYRGVSLT